MSLTSYFVDPYGHKVPSTSRYIVKTFCRECQKIWDKKDCKKFIFDGNMLIIKQRGHIIEQKILNTPIQ